MNSATGLGSGIKQDDRRRPVRAAVRVTFMTVVAVTAIAPRAAGEGIQGVPLKPVASIQDVMRGWVDPSADALWDAVSSEVSAGGTVDHQPRTDDEWDAQRLNALRLAEAANLLLVFGRPVADRGARLEDAQVKVVLPPAAIAARIARDPRVFSSRALVLRAAAEQALAATRAHDVPALLKAGTAIDEACEACHLSYWYPGGGPPPPKQRVPARP